MKEEKTFWQDLQASWKACATCLADRWIYRDLRVAALEFIKGLWFLLMKAVCTATFPLAGIILAFVVRYERRKLEARRQEFEHQVNESVQGLSQKT